jgi:DNA-directed RNA polymerase subunit RPC12/RpoP
MPAFDIYCCNCQEKNETYGEYNNLKCPNCGSKDIKRRWTGSPTIVMIGEPNGSTVGVRKKAQEIMRKETAKIERGYYGKRSV